MSLHPDIRRVVDHIALAPTFEGSMSILTLAQAHMFLAPPTDLDGVYRLRTLVSLLDAIASRSENRLQREIAA